MKKSSLVIGLVLGFLLTSCGEDQIFNEDAQLETDIILIEDFLDENNLEADTLLPSEIRIIIDDPGEDPKADFGSSVFTYYRGYYLDGTEFDSNETGDGFEFIVDGGRVLQGWNIAFKELGKGGRATFFLPSGLGYGNRPPTGIIPNAVLVFEVNVLDVR